MSFIEYLASMEQEVKTWPDSKVQALRNAFNTNSIVRRSNACKYQFISSQRATSSKFRPYS